MIRHTMLLTACLAFVCGAIIAEEPAAPAPAQPPLPPTPKLKPGATPLVVLKAGESRMLYLSWDDGVGRLPVDFLSDNLGVATQNFDGRKEFSRQGVTVRLADGQTGEVWKSFADRPEFVGEQPDKSYKHMSLVAIEVTAAADAPAGPQRFYFHRVSGTGRHMLLQAEFRVVVMK